MDYTIDPGLYALGSPDAASPVLVSANYKLSFDTLRAALPGRNAWILVLDTRGINVWCAAGKGTFGTEELIRRIAASALAEVVSHRVLVVPQLGAPGVAAHTVRKRSGFSVHYGPIAAADLPAYLDDGHRATGAMRIKPFPLRDRAVLIPVEFVAALKPALLATAVFFLLGGIGGLDGFWVTAWREGGFAALALWAAVVAGAAVHPLLLPWLPGRAFATKGLWLGAAVAVLALLAREHAGTPWEIRLGTLAWLLLLPAVTAYLAMNFTGCSTFTSLSGVRREMRWALPLEIGLGAVGALLWIASRLAA
jgi:acetyl-CoA decarbonylase/synthase complex subunit gamma